LLNFEDLPVEKRRNNREAPISGQEFASALLSDLADPLQYGQAQTVSGWKNSSGEPKRRAGSQFLRAGSDFEEGRR